MVGEDDASVLSDLFPSVKRYMNGIDALSKSMSKSSLSSSATGLGKSDIDIPLSSRRIQFVFQGVLRSLCTYKKTQQEDGEVPPIQEMDWNPQEDHQTVGNGDDDALSPQDEEEPQEQAPKDDPVNKTLQPPVVILFIDDLQWADTATLDLLQILLVDPLLATMCFIGSYRSNEVQGQTQHPLMMLMNDVEEKRKRHQEEQQQKLLLEEEPDEGNKDPVMGTTIIPVGSCVVEYMEIPDLSKDSIQRYICDVLDWDPVESQALVDTIYAKTTGNMFFTMQALELLVREKVIIHDDIFWTWNTSKSDDHPNGGLYHGRFQIFKQSLIERFVRNGPIEDRYHITSIANSLIDCFSY